MTIASFDPRTGHSRAGVESTPPEVVAAAVNRAVCAAPLLAATSPSVRRDWLHAVASRLEDDVAGLVDVAESETALGRDRLAGEVRRTADQLRFYGDVAARGSYLRATLEAATASSRALARVNQPVGPVAVFGASNFPFAFGVLGHDTASALAAGCPVVAKAHPAHPLLSERLSSLAESALDEAGAMSGTFDMVAGFEAGLALVQSDGVEAVAFTGSQTGGLALWRLANERERVIPVYAEMGTVNPVVLTPDASERMAEIARGLVASFTLGSGQFCTKPGLVLVPTGAGAVQSVMAAFTAAAPSPVMLTEGIAAAFRTGLDEMVAAGGRLVGAVAGSGAGWAAPAAVVEAPLAALVPGSRLLDECFGAVVVIAEYPDVARLQVAIAGLQGALAASVITGGAESDPNAAAVVAALATKVGRVVVDDWPTGVACAEAQHHGGPWPSTTDSRNSSVGAAALSRFVRPVVYQSAPDALLPPALRSSNPWGLEREHIAN